MSLVSKYNIAAPRYTSYPTVPYWKNAPTQQQWREKVKLSFDANNDGDGISLYIHLPYCESLCTYCACNTRITVNHKVEEPYIESLLKEWQLYLEVFGKRPKLRELHLGGGTPTFFSPENLNKLLQGIFKGSEICSDAEFSFEAHPANTTRKHLETLYQHGFRRISFGIQDFDLKVQDAINRMQSCEQVENAVNEARTVGFDSVNFDLVYGLPFQTLESVSETLDMVIRLRPDRIAFYSYAHVPWLKPGQRKFTEKDLPVDKEKRALYEKGLEVFEREGYKAVGMDHFSLPHDSLYRALLQKKMHRNFMGYTQNYTRLLVALGASSISDTWDAFAQNIKTVEEYQQAVNKGEFPIFKGHILSREDMVLRMHILNIMCKGYTSWFNENEQCEGLYSGLEKMRALENDGLVEISLRELNVTPLGMAFLRNICLCLDACYWERTPQAALFSSTV